MSRNSGRTDRRGVWRRYCIWLTRGVQQPEGAHVQEQAELVDCQRELAVLPQRRVRLGFLIRFLGGPAGSRPFS